MRVVVRPGTAANHPKKEGDMSKMSSTPETLPGPATADRRSRASKGAPPPAGGAVYGLGMIGALVYFLGSAETGRDYALAIGRAVVWPALLVYRAFRALD
jgi:hypothetical protein